MELWLFLALAFVGIVIAMRRSRRVGSSGPESMIEGLPDDGRDKYTIENARGGFQGHSGGTGGSLGGGGGSR
jgi:hypothetical protein